MPPTLDKGIKNRLIELYKQEVNISSFFLLEQIPPDKLSKAISSYGAAMKADETVIILYDDTVWGSSKDGFILTTKGLYQKNFGEKGGFVTIDQIDSMIISYGGLNSDISIKSFPNPLKITITKTEKAEITALYNMLNNSVELLKNPAGASAEPAKPGQPAAKKALVCPGCGAHYATYTSRCEYCDSPL